MYFYLLYAYATIYGMEERARFAVGIDFGSNKIRAVIGRKVNDEVTIVGFGEANSEGIRRGAISDLQSPIEPLNVCLHKLENMSGINISGASVSINTNSIASTKVDGTVTNVDGSMGRGIDDNVIERLNQTAIEGRVPKNRTTLSLIPFEYILDNQGGIRNPYGMIGTRLEIRANVISALTPDVENLNQLCIGAGNLAMHEVVPAAEAAATAIITNRQRENGIGVVNFGGATTSIAIYDEGELQYTSVIPMGSNDITRDLATILAATPDLAEDVKLRHADGQFKDGKDVTLTHGRDQYVFSRSEINEVVEARLDEIFEEVHNRLIASGYDKRLPEGLILTGGGAKMRNLDLYVRSKLSMAVRMGEVLPGITATDKNILKSDYTTAIGLMLRDMEAREYSENSRRSRKRHKNSGSGGNIFSKFMGFFH